MNKQLLAIQVNIHSNVYSWKVCAKNCVPICTPSLVHMFLYLSLLVHNRLPTYIFEKFFGLESRV